MVAIPRSSRTVVTRIRPSQRTFFLAASSARYTPTATVEKVIPMARLAAMKTSVTASRRPRSPSIGTSKRKRAASRISTTWM